ncbi:MAG TPA: TonB-dependent receptor [Parapedobacter sp.]|uniref:SusC/RagA family TonB-linked outer membrane protein n=1 Tax=Parapedobacter sp. TaxID=1958893 RepID=UPI002C87FEFA|nr:TonB-dependent receptor [Parapedobacter sp.]HWK59054.1 TonB-dependent receptor [Parapedobacter sp.]
MIVFLKCSEARPIVGKRLLLTIWFGCVATLAFAGMGHDVGTPAKNQQEPFIVRGIVSDESGELLVDASVQVLPAKREVKTGLDGRFLIEADSERDSLIVSYVGYTTKRLVIGKEREFNVRLEIDEEGQKLNEVVVVGFGTQKKTTMVGAVSSVSVGEIRKFSTPSLSNTIGGKIAGVITRQSSGEPGYDAASVYIRGIASISGGRNPLVIVDGVERELQNYWNTINIEEIADFTVLKDATATAVYGNRGANGVIVITTKRGSVGKPKVTFRSEFATATPLRVPNVINAYEYASLHNEALANVGEAPRYTTEEINKFRDGSDPYIYPNVDWYDVVLKETTKQSINNLGVSGGTEYIKYYVNLGYTLQEGIYNESSLNDYNTNALLNRYQFRSNVDMKLASNFDMNLGLSGIVSGTNYPGVGTGSAFAIMELVTPLMYPLTNPDGSAPGAIGVDGAINPYTLLTQMGYTKQFYNTIVSNLNFRWDLSSVLPGLAVKGLVAYDVVDITQNFRSKSPETYYYTRDSETGEDIYTLVSSESALGYGLANENYKTVYGDLSITYDQTFGQHSVSALLLGNKREFINVNAGSSLANLPERRQGLVGRFTYNYGAKYLLELNAGYNGSENFPKGKQYGLFPSIGAGWVVSNEDFWNANVVNMLKLRGSYGLVGNDQIGGGRFLFLSSYNKSAAGYVYGLNQNNSIGGKSEGSIGNQDVTWEKAYKTNVGADIELFNAAVSFQGDYFYELRKDQLLRRSSVPWYSGYPTGVIPYGNIGVTSNWGFEGSLQVRNTTSSGFFYSLLANFTFTKNKVIENDVPYIFEHHNPRGRAIGAASGYLAQGFFRDEEDIANSPSQSIFGTYGPGDIKYVDLNGNERIDLEDITYFGEYGPEPLVMYGFGTTLAWKGFDASLFFTGAANRDFFYGSGWPMRPFFTAVGKYNVLREYYDNRWVPGEDNADAVYPAIRAASENNYTNSSLWRKNGNYLRIKNAEVGYSFDSHLTAKIGITNLRLFVQGTNLYTWDHIKAIDPESNYGTGGHPITRNVNFGINVIF